MSSSGPSAPPPDYAGMWKAVQQDIVDLTRDTSLMRARKAASGQQVVGFGEQQSFYEEELKKIKEGAAYKELQSAYKRWVNDPIREPSIMSDKERERYNGPSEEALKEHERRKSITLEQWAAEQYGTIDAYSNLGKASEKKKAPADDSEKKKAAAAVSQGDQQKKVANTWLISGQQQGSLWV